MDLDFGPVSYKGEFKVMSEDVPLILGMTFLAEFAPKIDFAKRTVVKTVDGQDKKLAVWGLE